MLYLHPFLRLLELKLPGRRTRPTSVMAYADDVTTSVTSVADFAIMEKAIRIYERASGARLNPPKSKALAVGSWCTQQTVLGIAYHPYVTILGVTFWGTIEQTMKALGTINMEGTSAGKASLHSGPLPANTNALCQHFSPIEHLVHRANLAVPKHIHATDNRH